MTQALVLGAAVLVLGVVTPRLRARMLLSMAKHPSLAGHVRLAKRIAKLIPAYGFAEEGFFRSDDAPEPVAALRRTAFTRLAGRLHEQAPETIRMTEAIADGVSDLQFIEGYRVPFQYAALVRDHMRIGSVACETAGAQVRDLDGNLAYDLSGSYGLNVFGYDFYKSCIDAGIERVRALGPILGTYHPVVADNVARLREISGLDEVSFHMSGTEAVMQAVRLARYHTGRSHVVQFTGAYHGWWDGVQPGVGNPRAVYDGYVLKDVDDRTLRVLRTRSDIACVLVNPLQMLHPNASAPADGSLVSSASTASFDRTSYAAWLRRLRDVCTERNIVLIFDEVFMGFRLAYGGAQEYFDVRADMVTYGKTVGGGLPVGVLCGRRTLMRRFRSDRPADICFARGTFNAHPYVMGAMNEFLRRIDTQEMREAYTAADEIWNARARTLNAELAARRLPVRVANLCSVWTIQYTTPSRYNWMFQYYLRGQGLALSWVGSGRLIFSHNYSDADFSAVVERIVAAATAMEADGWWWRSPDLSDAAIAKRLVRETASAVLRSALSGRRGRSGQATLPAGDEAGRFDTA